MPSAKAEIEKMIMKKLKIRTRLTILYSAVLMLLLFLMFAVTYGFFSQALYSEEEKKIREYADYVADEVELEQGQIEIDLEDDDIAEINQNSLLSVYSLDGQLLASNHETAWLAQIPRQDNIVQEVEQGLRWQVYDTKVRDEGQEIAWLRIAIPLEGVIKTLSELRNIFLWGSPFCLLLCIVSGLWITRRALSPIHKISKTAQEIGEGDLSKRLDFPNSGDEIAELATTFDQMLDNLEAAFLREKQFSSDASHELRTPIAVIMAHAEEALANQNADESSYRTSLEIIGEKAKDMQRMLSQLLMLARGYEQSLSSEMMDLDIAQVLEDIAEEMQPRADEKNINIQLNLEKALWMQADLMLFTRMLMNLIDNGIKYGRENGLLLIILRRIESSEKGKEIELIIEDDGSGIPAEDLSHIFERFYRSDKARSGNGFGLGLSIVQWIATLHGGEIIVESIEGSGTRMIMHFPSL